LKILPYIDFIEVKSVLRKRLEQVEFDVLNQLAFRLKSVSAANDS